MVQLLIYVKFVRVILFNVYTSTCILSSAITVYLSMPLNL